MTTSFFNSEIKNKIYDSSNTFIVIGSFDGIGHDDFFDKVKNKKIKNIGQIVFVEPVTKWFLKLKENVSQLKDKYDIQCYNVAISDRNSNLNIVIPNSNLQDKYGPYIDECSCLVDGEHFYSKVMLDMDPNDVYYQEIKGITFDKLLDISNIKEIDFLKIDTEGHDLVILNSIDFYSHQIKYIKFEIQHVNKNELEEFLTRISNLYLVDKSENDCFLIRKEYFNLINKIEEPYKYDKSIFTIENYLKSDVGLNNSIRILDIVSSMGKNNNFVDLGVWHGFTSNILLNNSQKNNNIVYGVDVKYDDIDSYLISHPNYIKLVGDSVTIGKNWNRGEVGIIFIDTLHICEQVLLELYFWYPHIKEGGWVILHDTNWEEGKHDTYGGYVWDRPELAIKKFFNIDSLNYEDEFIKVINYPESNGMTFIQKKKSKQYGKYVDWNDASLKRNGVVKLFNYYYDSNFNIDREINFS